MSVRKQKNLSASLFDQRRRKNTAPRAVESVQMIDLQTEERVPLTLVNESGDIV